MCEGGELAESAYRCVCSWLEHNLMGSVGAGLGSRRICSRRTRAAILPR